MSDRSVRTTASSAFPARRRVSGLGTTDSCLSAAAPRLIRRLMSRAIEKCRSVATGVRRRHDRRDHRFLDLRGRRNAGARVAAARAAGMIAMFMPCALALVLFSPPWEVNVAPRVLAALGCWIVRTLSAPGSSSEPTQPPGRSISFARIEVLVVALLREQAAEQRANRAHELHQDTHRTRSSVGRNAPMLPPSKFRLSKLGGANLVGLLRRSCLAVS